MPRGAKKARGKPTPIPSARHPAFMPLPSKKKGKVTGSPYSALALKNEITTDPLTLGYNAAWASGDDVALCSIINAANYRGPVPISEIAAYCCTNGITGGIKAHLSIPVGATDNPPTTLSLQTLGALHTVLSLVEIDFRLNWCDTDDPKFGQICGLLISLGIMVAADQTALIALGNNRRSRAMVLWGDGVTGPTITPENVGAARRIQ